MEKVSLIQGEIAVFYAEYSMALDSGAFQGERRGVRVLPEKPYAVQHRGCYWMDHGLWELLDGSRIVGTIGWITDRGSVAICRPRAVFYPLSISLPKIQNCPYNFKGNFGFFAQI